MTTTTRRLRTIQTIAQTAAVMLMVTATIGLAHAQNFPAKPVKFIVPYPPGGPVDAFARGFAEKLGSLWGQTVVLDNRPGANEIIAADAVAKSASDGYTLLFAADPSLSQNQFLFAKLPYDPEKDLIPVSRVVDVNMVLIVKGDLPVSNLKEFIALMKKEGAKRNFGSAGNGNVTQLSFEAFKRDAGFEMTHIPFKGIAPAISDMLGGSIDAMFAEAGFPNTEARFYLGLSAPRGTPNAIVQKIAADVRRSMTDKAFLERFVDLNNFEAAGTSPEEFAQFLKTDVKCQASEFARRG